MMEDAPNCPLCNAITEMFDYGPTGREHFVCGDCGYTFALTEDGEPVELHDT